MVDFVLEAVACEWIANENLVFVGQYLFGCTDVSTVVFEGVECFVFGFHEIDVFVSRIAVYKYACVLVSVYRGERLVLVNCEFDEVDADLAEWFGCVWSNGWVFASVLFAQLRSNAAFAE